MTAVSKVNSNCATASATRTTPPWRRGCIFASKANSDTTSSFRCPANFGGDTSSSTGYSDEEEREVHCGKGSELSKRSSPPWRRASETTSDVNDDGAASPRCPSSTQPLRKNCDDDTSTTADSSDVDDVASSLSRSSSHAELLPTVSRDVMLLLRARTMRTYTEPPHTGGLQCRPVATPPPGLKKVAPRPAPAGFAPPPGLALLNGSAVAMPSYTPAAFRKDFMAILKDLALDRNVARAVRRVRAQGVPRVRQAAEYADAITFIVEETRGAPRRSFVALLAGLAYGVYERKECLMGLDIFFQDIFPDLKDEVPKLSKLVNVELLATLRSVFTEEELAPFTALVKA